MSYRSTILSDYPIGYFPLDDLTTIDISNYTYIVDNYPTYQDILDDPLLSTYANLHGDIAYDHSGSNNHAIYVGDPEVDILSIVLGNTRATKITNTNSISYSFLNDYTAVPTTSQFATLNSSDNDFTLEAWIYPHITTSAEFPIFGDTANNIGLFYKKGNIIFKVDSKEISWTAPYLDRVIHIVAVYKNDAAYLYIDGILQNNLSLSNFIFTNESISLEFGPTTNISDWMLGNSFAVYRYALSETQIKSHYQVNLGLSAIQIANPDSGSLFEIYDNNISTAYYYSYPANKPWSWFDQTNLYYNGLEDSVSISKSTISESKNAVLEDFISIPAGFDMNSSKIEWYGTNGIVVETSLDGISWEVCSNRESIPQYNLVNFDTSRNLYLKITLSTTDASVYIPKLYNLGLSFYNNQILYAVNSGEKITMGENSLSTLGNNKYNILSRDARNGILCPSGSGFAIDLLEDYQTIELFYTRLSEGDSGLLVSADGVECMWDLGGNINYSGISSIWVNGVDKSTESNIDNVFKLDQLSHIIIVLDTALMGILSFNNNSIGNTKGLYQNITLYPSVFNSILATEHYSLYALGSTYSISDFASTSLSLTENSINTYNNDWLIVQNV